MRTPLTAASVILSNLREHTPGGRVTYATKFKPYVQGESAITLHRTREVLIVIYPAYTAYQAYFECGNGHAWTSHPVFFNEPNQPGSKLCKRCFEL